MNLEEIVRTSIDQLARELQPTVPDPAAVRARVNKSRRVRSFAAAGLAAAVAAGVVVGVAQHRDDSNGTGPADRVEIGVDANAVWMIDDVLYIGDQVYPQDSALVTALVPVEGGVVFGSTKGQIVYQPAGGAAEVIQTDGDANPPGGPVPLGPAADPDSSLVAILRWSTADGRYDLYFYDTARGQQVAGGIPLGDDTWDVSGDPNPFGETPVAPIYWVGRSDGDYTMLFRNGQELRREDAQANGSATGTPIGRAPLDATLDVVATAGAGGGLTFTTLDGQPLSSVDAVQPDGGLSHDGQYYAAVSTDPEHAGAIAVVSTDSGETRYLDPPSGTTATLPSWSAGHTLMFRAADTAAAPSGLVVSCDADTLDCVNVAQVDDIDQTVLPRL